MKVETFLDSLLAAWWGASFSANFIEQRQKVSDILNTIGGGFLYQNIEKLPEDWDFPE